MSGSRKISVEQRLKRFPPIVCRLLAREGRGGLPNVLSDQQISERSGLSVAQVQGLSHLLTWDDVPCRQMLSFSTGCGVDFSSRDSMNKHWKYIQHCRSFNYLRKHSEYESRWKPMYAAYVEYLKSHAKTSANR